MPNETSTAPEKPKSRYQPLPQNEGATAKTLYEAAIEHLDNNFAYFLTHILNIGAPQWTSAVPTACVAVDAKLANEDIDRAFKFLFSQDFARSLDTEEMAFIMGHETMHILLNHLKLCKNKTFKDNPKKFNIAADCVINDYLVQMGLKCPDMACRGQDFAGYNCANATVTDVFNAIPDEKVNGEGGECDGSCQPSDGSGQGQPCDGSCGKHQTAGRQLDDHGWMHDSDEDQEDAAEKAGDETSTPANLDRLKEDDDFQSDANPGFGEGGRGAFCEDKGVGLKWAELLEKVNPFMFKRGIKPRPSWHRQPRKLSTFPETRLPIEKKGDQVGRYDKPAIVMALDVSGSIGQEQANQFMNMARSIPQNKIKLFVCAFTNKYQVIDLDDPEWTSGGTDFDPISAYIEDVVKPHNRKRYPSAVVVVTDGEASFANKRPNDKEAKSWYWLLTRDGVDKDYSDQPFPGEIDRLKRFQKGAK
jgi:predicted metal-dependent peptidase